MNNPVPEAWKFAKLDDVAEETSDRVDNPSQSGYDRFVGLEHLDTGELTVRRWGSTADLRSAMKLFKSGDILIGRRNVYLKRASKVEFDGVCSGDAYVVREKKGKIEEGLLPIILNSDSFWNYTIAHASGTMSKRAKWRDLTEYSFLLPSPEEQHRITTMLWAVEDCIVKVERFLACAERAKQVLMRELFSKGIGHNDFQQVTGFGKIPKEWEFIPIGQIANVTKLAGYEYSKYFNYPDGGEIIAIRALNIKNNKLDLSNIQRVTKEISDKLPRSKINSGDILITYIGAYIGDVLLIEESDKYHLAPNVAKITPHKEIYPKFLEIFLTSRYCKEQIKQLTTTTAAPSLTMGQIRKIKVLKPVINEQRQIAAILTRCDETIAAARANVATAKALKMKMINEMLNPKNH